MSDPPDPAWLDALLGGTDGVEIPPQSQGVGSIALSQMYRDAAMLEQESLALGRPCSGGLASGAALRVPKSPRGTGSLRGLFGQV